MTANRTSEGALLRLPDTDPLQLAADLRLVAPQLPSPERQRHLEALADAIEAASDLSPASQSEAPEIVWRHLRDNHYARTIRTAVWHLRWETSIHGTGWYLSLITGISPAAIPSPILLATAEQAGQADAGTAMRLANEWLVRRTDAAYAAYDPRNP